jgi:hypothetical protein
MSKDGKRIVGLYQERADAWDAVRSRDLIEQGWLDRFMGLLPAGGSVLDIGCGSGEPIACCLVEAGRPLPTSIHRHVPGALSGPGLDRGPYAPSGAGTPPRWTADVK